MSSAPHRDAIDLAGAVRRLDGRVHRTPMLHSCALDEAARSGVWMKAETFQRGGSFKARGAFNAALAGLESGDRRGLLAVSSGNHGQAVALAARDLGLPATVVMPADSSTVKLDGVRGYGARVVTAGVTATNREEIAAQISATSGLRLIHPHNDPLVIAGQATVGREIAQQVAALGLRPRAVLVPVGGGGLLAGVALALADLLPQVPVIGVEPATGDDAAQSLRLGRLVSLPHPPGTVADGARTMHLGSICWEVIRGLVSLIVTVTDLEIARACWWLWTRCKLVVEPTGAMAVAALLSEQPEVSGLVGSDGPRDIVCVLSGGNCVPGQIAELVARLPEVV